MASGAAALRYWERRQEISSNNLANVSTEGFKGERGFARLVENGLSAVEAVTNYSPGTITPTANPLDIAIKGRGFIMVETDQGVRLSKGGSLGLATDGRLVDRAGNTLIGRNGPVILDIREDTDTNNDLVIQADGTIFLGTEAIDQIRMIEPPAATQLERAGAGLFIPPAGFEAGLNISNTNSRNATQIESQIIQGSIEESNVSAIEEMVDMISIQRAYAAVQKAISTLDATRGIAVSDLGKPVN